MTNALEHIGLVTENKAGRLKISLVGSGCSACHKSLCMLGESKAKEVVISGSLHFKAGEEVLVRINPASGYTAVVLLYLVPFLLMLLTLIIVLRLGYSEGWAGLGALLILVPYFLFLYGIRKSFHKQCKMEIVSR
jgi:positive regulator of sigma E activity